MKRQNQEERGQWHQKKPAFLKLFPYLGQVLDDRHEIPQDA
jgi:hypothetical protein